MLRLDAVSLTSAFRPLFENHPRITGQAPTMDTILLSLMSVVSALGLTAHARGNLCMSWLWTEHLSSLPTRPWVSLYDSRDSREFFLPARASPGITPAGP